MGKANDTSFKPGHPKIEGCGRPPGSKNKNKILRDYMRDASIELFPKFLEALTELRTDDPKAFCDLYMKMTERVIPKMASLQFEVDDNTNNAMMHLRNLASWNKNENGTDKEDS